MSPTPEISTEPLPEVTRADSSQPSPPQPQDSYTKLAMRNMVRKSRQSLVHFALTVIGLLSLLVGLAYLTR